MAKILRILVVATMLATVAPAIVKREEFQPSDSASSAHLQSAPVYNAASYSNQGNGYAPTYSQPQPLMYSAGQPTGVQGNQPNEYQEAASSNVQPSSAQPNGQGPNQGAFQQNAPNLYYYYYPVQADNKPKEAYQAQPSNQYSSQVQPNQPNGPQGQDEGNHNQNQPQNGNPDLNYGAQDLSYAASLNENGNNQNNGAGPSGQNGFESQLNGLASSLQQYGFGGNAGAGGGPGPSFNGFSASQLSNFGGLGENAFANSQMNSPFANEAFAAAVNQLGNFGGQPSQMAPQPSSSSGSGLSHLYQQASQMYQGLLGGGSSNGNQVSGSSSPYAAASQPHPSYEASAPSSYRSKYGLGTLIMPMLALAGLSLLIPTVTSFSAVSSRKKRSVSEHGNHVLPSAAGSISNYIDRLERYYSLYKTAVEREECMNRIICELGDAVSNVRGKAAFFTVVEKMVPTWMGNKVNVFKSGALSAENGKCKKYNCH